MNFDICYNVTKIFKYLISVKRKALLNKFLFTQQGFLDQKSIYLTSGFFSKVPPILYF